MVGHVNYCFRRHKHHFTYRVLSKLKYAISTYERVAHHVGDIASPRSFFHEVLRLSEHCVAHIASNVEPTTHPRNNFVNSGANIR